MSSCKCSLSAVGETMLSRDATNCNIELCEITAASFFSLLSTAMRRTRVARRFVSTCANSNSVYNAQRERTRTHTRAHENAREHTRDHEKPKKINQSDRARLTAFSSTEMNGFRRARYSSEMALFSCCRLLLRVGGARRACQTEDVKAKKHIQTHVHERANVDEQISAQKLGAPRERECVCVRACARNDDALRSRRTRTRHARATDRATRRSDPQSATCTSQRQSASSK